ncbi:MAG: hypothetical protein EOP56_01230 [Sphingobacteriales bacterium]|nr:MAG: hypothetical protein EOP56_01230 [Sphingobacteriales bacterium]
MMLTCSLANAQKAFKEGILVYHVTLDPPENQEGVIQYTGTYTITIKDKQVKKELKMDNGFGNVMLFNEKEQTVYTLKEMQGKKYAIQIEYTSLEQKRARFENFSIKEKGKDADIAGLPVNRGIVTYKDGTTKDLQFSKEWEPEVLLFEQLPGIKVLPLIFVSRTDDGMQMHFTAQQVLAQPVESSIFKIPQDYKVMSSQEYRQLSR